MDDIEGDPKATTPDPARKFLVEAVETVVLTLLIFFAIQTFVVQPYQVQQESMHSTFEPGDYVLVDKVTPRFAGYARGDVVVFNPVHRATCDGPVEESESEEPFIKRVIGLPGETVEVSDGGVRVGEAFIDEPYTHGNATTAGPDAARWTVPDGSLFVMGDNRPDSVDSRVFGPICERDVIGRGWLRYWPISTAGVLSRPTY